MRSRASRSASWISNADNGSEYIDHRVCALPDKLHIGEFTKSRARRSNDNARVESKNGAVVRKHFGDAHIPGRFAARTLNQARDQRLHSISKARLPAA